MTVRVLTYNVLNGRTPAQGRDWTQRRSAVAALIRDADPDFSGIQEAFDFQLDDLLEALPSRSAIGQGRQGGRCDEHSAILYCADAWELVDVEDFWLSTTPAQPGSRIDWILCSPHFEVQGVEVLTGPRDAEPPSDHYPVLATLRLAGNGAG